MPQSLANILHAIWFIRNFRETPGRTRSHGSTGASSLLAVCTDAEKRRGTGTSASYACNSPEFSEEPAISSTTNSV